MSDIDVSFLDRNNLFAGIVNKLSQKTALQKQMIVFSVYIMSNLLHWYFILKNEILPIKKKVRSIMEIQTYLTDSYKSIQS